MARLQTYESQKDGNVAIVFAVSITALGLCVGAAVDATRLISTDQKLQDAVDATTLYAATFSSDEDMESKAQTFLADKVSALNFDSLSSSFQVGSQGVVGSANADLDLVFGGFLDKDMSSVAALTRVTIPNDSPCIVALSETQSPGLLLNGGATVSSTSCEVHVHSTRSPAMTVNSGTNLEPSRTCVSGRTILNHSGSSDGIETNCSVSPDPYAGVIPVPDSSNCDYNDTVYVDDNVSLTPGVYCGTHNFQNDDMIVDFAPGLYVIRGGGWSVNGSEWNGAGVTFYYADASGIQFNSAVKATMTPPTSGPYTDIFMAEAPGLTQQQFVLNDARGFDFDGVIHLPSRELVLNSGATVRAREMAIVADTIIINGAQLLLEPVGGGGAAQTAYIAE